MIHLFYVHSHTTYLSALGTIKLLNVPVSDVVFVLSRNYKINNEMFPSCETIDFSDQFTYLMLHKHHIKRSLRKTREIDSIINAKIGANYLAFLPHIGVFMTQIIASHPLCIEVNFIEEGSACYSKRMQAQKGLFKNYIKYIISKFLFPTKRFWLADLLFKDLYGNLNINCTYGLSVKTFQFLPYKKKIIQWQKFNIMVEIDEKYPIFIFDALVEMNFVEPKLYWLAVKQMIQKSACEHNYIKFHPYQNSESKNIIKSQFEKQEASYIELAQNVIIEDLIVNKEYLTFNGFSSSILLYAKIYNHKVNSFETLLQEDKKYRDFRKLYDFEI